MNKGIYSLIGFSMFIIGMVALILSMVGIQLSFLQWMDAAGRGMGLVIRLAVVILGVVLIVVTRSDFSGRKPVD